jgi:hypothetical protein
VARRVAARRVVVRSPRIPIRTPTPIPTRPRTPIQRLIPVRRPIPIPTPILIPIPIPIRHLIRTPIPIPIPNPGGPADPIVPASNIQGCPDPGSWIAEPVAMTGEAT